MNKTYMVTIYEIDPTDAIKLAKVIEEITKRKVGVTNEQCGNSNHCHLLLESKSKIDVREVSVDDGEKFLNKIPAASKATGV